MLLLSPHIKFFIWAIFILSGIALLLMYLLPPGPPPRPGPHEGPGQSGEELSLKGVVKEFKANPKGDIDKLLLSTSNEHRWIAFPPHTARQVMQLAPKGSSVAVTVRSGGPARMDTYKLLQISSGDAVLLLTDMVPPPPVAGQETTVSGKISRLLTDQHNEVSGFVLDHFMVAIPPHFSRSVAPLMQAGTEVQVKGYERSAESGFVNTSGLILLKPYRITIDSTDYLL